MTKDTTRFSSVADLDRLDEIRKIAGNYSKLLASSAFLGNAPSNFRGAGLEFGELRSYADGEDARNIDWKASLRAGELLAKSYLEERERRVLVICQTSSPLKGETSAGELKGDVVVNAAGAIAYVSRSYGDRFAFMFDSDDGVIRTEFRSSMPFLEDSLSSLERACNTASPERKGVQELLGMAFKDMGNRIVVFVVGDEPSLWGDSLTAAESFIKAGGDVRLLGVDDAYLFKPGSYDVDAGAYLPFIPAKKLAKLHEAEKAQRATNRDFFAMSCSRSSIPYAVTSSSERLPDALLSVLSSPAARERRA